MENIEIREFIPHRYPFLFVDRILELEIGKRAIGIKNVSVNEPYFQGHFPGNPIMPGVLIIEAMAQLAGVVVMAGEKNKNKIGLFTSIDKCKFKKMVYPGDQLKLEVEIISFKMKLAKVRGKAMVGEDIVATADIAFLLADKE
ncbi:3-hydroxyacyl-ACP dehydratase FabZ [Aceticella autotrophica]|uniref:3-hydroxyacyl-[acyl-carrier-protein] dehydratase FabZ n=1 Tax=Aceticella autotrophica TaxID=2755338 RepID=A0A975GAS1_9THEO|nr:3-hydroxyacyl-ACP dehydratase FabZ [Aceticella autotrophica]QSZ27698.1 3-hydroxyacyl-ACP dehydratase FabZ [Aceticella autotrophica]